MQPGWKKNAAIVGIIAGVYVGLKYIFPVMVPFFAAWLLAVWMHPAVCRLERRFRIKRSVWAALFLCLLGGAAGTVLYLGGAKLLEQLRALIVNYRVLENYGTRLLNQCCDSVERIVGISGAAARAFFCECADRMRRNFLDDIGPDTFLYITGYVKGLILLVSGVIVTVIAGVLFVRDLTDIRRNLRTFRFYPRWRRVLHRMRDIGAAYLKAQVIIMTLIAVICTLGMWLLGSPYYLLFGIGLGVLDALPIIGTGLVLYPAILLFFLRGRTMLAVGCILIELVTSVVREFLEPRLLGGRLGVYPVVIMAAVYLGFIVFGVFGFLLGPAALLLIYSIGKEWDIWD